jgi:hypothetical protein
MHRVELKDYPHVFFNSLTKVKVFLMHRVELKDKEFNGQDI